MAVGSSSSSSSCLESSLALIHSDQIPNVQQITKDPKTQKILQNIFEISKDARVVWNQMNARATFPARVVPLSKEECEKIQMLSLTALTKNDMAEGKLSRSSIYYYKELDERRVVVYLIVEMMNAFLAKEFTTLTNNAKQYDSETFAVEKEKIEWKAVHFASPIISEFYNDVRDILTIYEDFDDYLRVQKEAGHTKSYEDMHAQLVRPQEGDRLLSVPFSDNKRKGKSKGKTTLFTPTLSPKYKPPAWE
jgi:hypothetical protein